MLEEYVSSGSYSISSSEDKALVALLGTCVGLALCDRTAGVGGLIHFLLPEPSGTTTSWGPENYASTGLSPFIDKLVESGAHRDRLEASIAGGSLLGPVSKQDLNLNIGGRTTEIVLGILHNEKIPVVRAETGGFSPSTLRLNLKTWEATIESIRQRETGSRAAGDNEPISIDKIEKTIERTKPIPQIALKIIGILQEEEYNMSDLAREIKQDQVIGAKILRYCNSVLIGARKHIDSIDQALLLLGESHLLEIVLSASVDSFFAEQPGGYSLMRGGLHKHALGVANAAKVIAHFSGRIDPGTAYTAGLLHDIGKVVLDQFVAGSCSLFNQGNHADYKDYIELERKLFGVDHQETGRRLAMNWSLPDTLVETIEKHHLPERATAHTELVHVVYLADLLTSMFMAGLELERIDSEFLELRLREIGLRPSQLTVIVDKVPWNKLMYM